VQILARYWMVIEARFTSVKRMVNYIDVFNPKSKICNKQWRFIKSNIFKHFNSNFTHVNFLMEKF